MNTDIKNTIIESGDKVQYDEKAKRVLGNKHILAQILSVTVGEFKGMNPKEVYRYIEGEPIIKKVSVEPGMTNDEADNERIGGLNTEDSEINEGTVLYDIIFYVRMRDGLAQIIINVEAQKDDPQKYNIINRTVYYACRMISSQKNRDFDKENFDDIKQIYTIWVCMDAKQNSLNHIHLVDDKLLGDKTWKGRLDLLNIVMIGIGDEIAEKGNEEYRLHRLLGAVFSEETPVDEKLKVMEDEYGIPMEKGLKEDVENMCNLSQGIEERGEARGIVIGEARGIVIGEARGIIQTAEDFGATEEMIIRKIQEKMNVTAQQAKEYFRLYGKKSV